MNNNPFVGCGTGSLDFANAPYTDMAAGFRPSQAGAHFDPAWKGTAWQGSTHGFRDLSNINQMASIISLAKYPADEAIARDLHSRHLIRTLGDIALLSPEDWKILGLPLGFELRMKAHVAQNS
eukprot:CAMPEP_0177648250 /NCGR_PEP_ID=MMETSP0447-20121125/10731_1 /TAXON_ID=0 /ORGANISM="Stygamoeba regulata, Strain BSH-02190019" /LENGTH=122 /DNA_ID=CAMNT_0019150885 /DNA_START=496 /DNA_END=864 /DNA_ORIENTATION=-